MAVALSDGTELWADYSESNTNDSKLVKNAYRCVWSDRNDFADVLLQSANSDYSWLICTDVEIKPLGTVDTSAGGPDQAKVTVTWKNPSFANNSGQDQVANDWSQWTEHWEGAAEALTVDKTFKRSDTGAYIHRDDVEEFLLFPLAQITISGKTDVISKANLLGTAGKVNASAVTIKGYSYPAETLLFEGADLDDGNPPDSDTSVWNLTYKFAYRPLTTWNKFFRPSGSIGYYRVLDADDNPPYTTAEFSDLDPANW